MTIKAQEKTKIFMSEKNDSKYLRLFVEAGGCSGFQYGLSLENEKQTDDKEFQFDTLTLLVDPSSLTYVENAEIDYTETLGREGYSIKNPQAKSTCGCGKSDSF